MVQYCNFIFNFFNNRNSVTLTSREYKMTSFNVGKNTGNWKAKVKSSNECFKYLSKTKYILVKQNTFYLKYASVVAWFCKYV